MIADKEKILLISEIYGPVIQGEGPVIGVPTIFVRLAGCDYRCGLDRETGEFSGKFVCDSLYAVIPEQYGTTWRKMTVGQIMFEVQSLKTRASPSTGFWPLITLSGGNPALQNCLLLVEEGRSGGYKFAIETQGTKSDTRWWRLLEWVVLSPKPPSSKMGTNWLKLSNSVRAAQLAKNWAMKIVVFDEDDFQYAKRVWDEYRPSNFYLQAGTSGPYRSTSSFDSLSMFREDILRGYDWLSNRVIEEGWYDARVLPQLHALAYGAKRGV